MNSALDYLAIGIIAAALAVASHGGMLTWLLCDLSLLRLYYRIKPKSKTFAESLARLPKPTEE